MPGPGLEAEMAGDDDELISQGVYYFEPERFSRPIGSLAIDLAAIDVRSSVQSEATETRQNFKSVLNSRDRCCIFSGVRNRTSLDASHIIPFSKRSSHFAASTP